MNNVDLAFTSALQQARLIQSKEVSPLELTQLYLERIERFDSRLGSYVTVAADMALAEAKAKTEELVNSDISQLPPFFGVPIAIKDLNAVKGLPCTYGTPVLKDKIAPDDEGVVVRIKQAGFIILGKTATSELGSLPYTEPPGFQPTRNPWNLDYTPGGSSGGAAAALAAGLSPIAQASDGGGSIRGPAFCCGLVGLKPTRGRISYAPVGDHQSGIATNGVLSRTVADAAALLDVMSGYISGDPYWLPDPEISFLAASSQTPPQLKIAFSSTVQPIGAATEVCRNAVQETVDLLTGMGHIVEEGCPDFSGLIEPFKKVWQAGIAAAGIPLSLLSPMNRWIGEQSGSAGEYLQAVTKMQIVSRQIVGFFSNFDVLVLPTYMYPTIRIGEWADLSPAETLENIIKWIAPCPPFNASGLPAIAIPTGFDSNGIPVGIQLVGKPAAEATLIALAAQLEIAKPWIHQRPPLFGD
ncbi:MAG TPA: amidase [Cyanobacteria bacterium UBA11149]|nr:amidase [Cyanobacteria bacterium UBA11367]HBE60070.1 amidase [Cyanobacteria bacterium UBA11366]HBK64832.1 amidase [Cyanobacteria bacterium UBA11166]HBR76148.1 amidase [Cyanobacteria bacterium UBA11159]HBS72501.1 amidase [Cyanobacteria bacterium UBA11153]HBW87908.1 amidase [Cyanobacteria bacterium UBA11149]HCA97246.1 amidase [Cyanobacteria bacterium UBA9226]